MSVLAYNISDQLKKNLDTIDSVRTRIHLLPLSPKEELHFRWEGLAEKIYWSLILAQVEISKELVLKVLSETPSKKLNLLQRDILNYKKAFDYIRYEWLGSKIKITNATIKKLYDIACRPTLGSSDITFKSKRQVIDRFLEYLQTGNEHPIIQAGVAYIQTYLISPYTDGVGRLSRLVAYLFLYRYGYDFRGFLVFEEFMRKDLVALREARESVSKRNTLTLWLEYWAYALGVQADKALRNVSTGTYSTQARSSLWKLNRRQKEIVSLLDNPDVKMTNRQVQAKFSVSQITASRDLSKLTNLGLLVARGNGRSRFYLRGPLF
ncbi:MAG: hypothetical protein UX13_C0017G0002 [Candidatus Woesebacteria bacterium GW2011_GWB1_45_5]|uniref:Fido domain-containing protein n=1 Tax=Candidatus Woesebacteria bacterium GW2011_GWB1_45_5 TaxID=1618581 RepID=A0A0G1QNK6_9BACT|nr:MAG: hypothetical protein UX13_C0017G0002 [Candidatus Woesebacteria bacterium GW2011_GWB1_45_5]